MLSPYLGGSSRSYLMPLLLIFFSITTSASMLILIRILNLLLRPRPTSFTPRRPPASSIHPTHLLIVLGSGGHTAEMLSMLRRLPFLGAKFSHRTYIVSSGDGFSALKAKELEMEMTRSQGDLMGLRESTRESYDIVTIRRARRVHQSLFTTPWSALLCLSDCIKVLRGTHSDQIQPGPQLPASLRRPKYPDLILTNGPGTGVCVVMASLILLFFGFSGPALPSPNGPIKESAEVPSVWPYSGQMRTIFVESWARIKTLSLSGKILLPLVDRFLVQWPGLEGRGGGKAEFVGAIIA